MPERNIDLHADRGSKCDNKLCLQSLQQNFNLHVGLGPKHESAQGDSEPHADLHAELYAGPGPKLRAPREASSKNMKLHAGLGAKSGAACGAWTKTPACTRGSGARGGPARGAWDKARCKKRRAWSKTRGAWSKKRSKAVGLGAKYLVAEAKTWLRKQKLSCGSKNLAAEAEIQIARQAWHAARQASLHVRAAGARN